MTLVERLTEKITALDEQYHTIVKSIYSHEVELNVEKGEKKRIQREIAACKVDLVKLQESKQ